jgi:hypothetical protein
VNPGWPPLARGGGGRVWFLERLALVLLAPARPRQSCHRQPVMPVAAKGEDEYAGDGDGDGDGALCRAPGDIERI